MAGTRYEIRIDPWWQPLLLAGGATPRSSYVELEDGALDVRFGYLFHRSIPRAQIERAGPARWPWWMGVGWRTNFAGTFGLIGSYQGSVQLELSEAVRVWGALSFRRLVISLREPERFLADLATS